LAASAKPTKLAVPLAKPMKEAKEYSRAFADILEGRRD
jgi:hypothetical protein